MLSFKVLFESKCNSSRSNGKYSVRIKSFTSLLAINCIISSLLFLFCEVTKADYGSPLWHKRDNFDLIEDKLNRVNHDNCHVVDRNQLFLPPSSVSEIPDIKQFGIDPIYPNRTNLLHINNVALNRAFFFSYILQKAPDDQEPGFMYYILSSAADISANPLINASAIYYSPNRAFTPSYMSFFNKTMPLFAPRAHRIDDYNDPYQLRGVSTMNTIAINDLGAIRPDIRDTNYTSEVYKINEWYSNWLPDLTNRHDSKPTYSVQITNANGTRETFVFHGPPGASDDQGPVKWQRPYFDCDRTNKWLFGASVPIADLFPRHTGWRHIELPLYVAAVVIETDFERLDLNQCPASELDFPSPLSGSNQLTPNGNGNFFADTAKCKKETTTCEPFHGFGFRRGGYQCRCKPGFRLPRHLRGPYLSELLERASELEYQSGFQCEKIDNIAVRTQNVQPMTEAERQKIIAKMDTQTGLITNEQQLTSTNICNSTLISSSYSSGSRYDINKLSELIRKPLTQDQCQLIAQLCPGKLHLPGNVAYGKEKQFENQARAALRLSHFISSFLQLLDPNELFAEFRVSDKPLTRDQLIGESLSTLIGDRQLVGVGIWLERPGNLGAPYAYRLERNARNFFVLDMASTKTNGPATQGIPDDNHYTQNEAFQRLKTRWMSNTEILDTFTLKANIRFNSTGINLIRYDRYPLQYSAPQLQHGYWSSPYHDCGAHNQWLISYGSPIFGFDKLRMKVEFKGIVIINVKLADLDINQCDSESYHNTNAFRDTHKCDRKSTKCIPIQGRKFDSGGYKCECQQGYEYPFNNPRTYIDGQMMEAEYSNVLQGRASRIKSLACRLATH